MIPEFVPIQYNKGLRRNMSYQAELKEKVHKEMSDWQVELLEDIGFTHRDRWYEYKFYKYYPLRSGDFFITEDGKTIFHGTCLDGMEMRSMLKMIGVLER